MATNLLVNVKPLGWNNIPIPIVDAFEAVTTSIKKLAGQLELNFESLRRRVERSGEDINEKINESACEQEEKWTKNS